MDQPVATIIDAERCIGCGECVRVCPKETISMQADKAVVTGAESMLCGHCQAACPVDAISVGGLSTDTTTFDTFETSNRWIAQGDCDTGRLVNLMRSRRSCRNYDERNVEIAKLQDLVKIGVSAPSGTNSQAWTFTLLPTRAATLFLGQTIGDFFRKLNRRAANPFLRYFLAMLGKKELQHYHRDRYRTVKAKLQEWDDSGKDCLFWGAPAVIVIATKPEAACPKEDAAMAAQNILLGAHCMGLGTCVIGYAAAAMNAEPSIQGRIQIPAHETIQVVITVGYPNETYERPAGRLPVLMRTFTT